MSAKSILEYNAGKVIENKKVSCNLTTDLTAAYDMVDHGILVEKLKYHGISDEAAEVLNSFLKDRKYYVEVQGFKSNLIEAMNVSVVQGGKLAGLLYTIYTAEIPLISELMKSPEVYLEITGKRLPDFNEIDHKTTNFIDDSSNVVGADSIEELELYIQHFYYLLSSYYKINKLKMNGEKPKIMMLSNNKRSIKISTEDNEVISCDSQMKILGWWVNPNNSMDTHLSKVKASVYLEAFTLKPAMCYLNLQQRREVVNAKILSKI